MLRGIALSNIFWGQLPPLAPQLMPMVIFNSVTYHHEAYSEKKISKIFD